MSKKIKFSIITVAYNAVETIRDTIESVIGQTYKDIEYIIVDGGSTDGTLDIIDEYRSNIQVLISEKDEGIYDAMNKGLAETTGDIVAFLNADDYYDSNSILSNVSRSYPFDILATSTVIEYGSDRVKFSVKKMSTSKLNLRLPFMHPSVFLSKNVLSGVGGFCTDYRLAADCDLFLRIYRSGYQFEMLDIVTVVMRSGGASDKGFIEGRKEYLKAYLKNNGSLLCGIFGYIYSVSEFYFYNLYRRFK